ncbi:hypothetical protein [Xylophilus sp. GOD-11R]|uniref:hypothetical protein n=1 Tax=Xylophilus sp. GOD-11R TaxID=3089814 RepID=UPI00298C0EED|nr:hypothetical protein [Xylophilus sp. GOD-11R]WPB58861.1 hypothetical protein R9X41_09565 [Xylophilus sp. GOD-11R]
MTAFEEKELLHNIKRIANALERQNDLLARQADIGFVTLSMDNQAKVNAWDQRRYEAACAAHAKAYPVESPPVADE